MITISELSNAVRKFVSDHNWQHYHDPKNLSMAIAVEAAELMEIFQWETNESLHKVISGSLFASTHKKSLPT